METPSHQRQKLTSGASISTMLRLTTSRCQPRVRWVRWLGMKPREDFLLDEPAPPPHSLDAVKPPKYWEAPPVAPSDPMAYVRSPVSSAHMIDDGKLSARDSVALSSSGAVVHGRYGELGVIQDVPLEYLALLRPAAEGAAALRSLPASDPGTLIVYGASQASGLAVVQLAAAAGHAVVAVVDGSHSGNEEIVDAVKGLAVEPGCAVAEEYALCKKNFEELVGATTSGEVILSADPGAYLVDFKANMMEYAKAYPESRPAAVSQSHLDFYGKDKDRENFQENMTAYLQQYPAGSPPIDPAGLEANFTQEKYSLFKSKFNDQTAAVITGDDVGEFNPAEVVSSMIHSKASGNQSDEDPIQYQFSLSKNDSETETIGGGPVIGAVIVFTPELERAAVAVAEAGPTKRAKAEALQCLSASERNAFSAATAVAGEAAKRGAAVRLIGGNFADFETAEASDADVQEALAAMSVADDGTSKLNYFIQVYRANDFPIYTEYAAHRATEVLAGPRQIVVTK